MSVFERQLTEYSEPLEVLGPLQQLVETLQYHTQNIKLGPLVLPLLRLVQEDASIVQQFALQALNLIFDINPQHIEMLHHQRALSSLCAIVLAATDVDLTEQALKCLHLACRDHGTAILDEGGIRASLAYFPYWNTGRLQHFQKTALQLCSQLISGVHTHEHLLQLWSVLPTLCEAFQNEEQSISSLAGECLSKLFRALSDITVATSRSKRAAQFARAGDGASAAEISHFVHRVMQTRIARICARHCFGPIGNSHQEQRDLCWKFVQSALQFNLGWLLFDAPLLQEFLAAVNRSADGAQVEELHLFPPCLDAGLAVFPNEEEAAELLQKLEMDSLVADTRATEMARQTLLSAAGSSEFHVRLDGVGSASAVEDCNHGSSATTATAAPPAQWSCVACTFLNAPDRLLCEVCETPNPAAPQGAMGGTCPWAGMLPCFNSDELGEPEQAETQSRSSRSRGGSQAKHTRIAALCPPHHGLVIAMAEFVGPSLLGLFMDDQTPLKLRLRILQFVRMLQIMCPEVLMPETILSAAGSQPSSQVLYESVPGLLAGLCNMLANVHPSDFHEENVDGLCTVLTVTLAFVTQGSAENKRAYCSLMMCHGLVPHLKKVFAFNQERDTQQRGSSRRGSNSRSPTSPVSLAKDILVALLDEPPALASPPPKKSKSKKRRRSQFHTMSYNELVELLDAIPMSPTLMELRHLNQKLQDALDELHADSSSQPAQATSNVLRTLRELVACCGASSAYELQASGALRTLRSLMDLGLSGLRQTISSAKSYCAASNLDSLEPKQLIARVLLDSLFSAKDTDCSGLQLARMVASSVPVKTALPLVAHVPSQHPRGISSSVLFQQLRLEIAVHIPGYEAIGLTEPVTIGCSVEPICTVKEFRDKMKQSACAVVERSIVNYKRTQASSTMAATTDGQRRERDVDDAMRAYRAESNSLRQGTELGTRGDRQQSSSRASASLGIAEFPRFLRSTQSAPAPSPSPAAAAVAASEQPGAELNRLVWLRKPTGPQAGFVRARNGDGTVDVECVDGEHHRAVDTRHLLAARDVEAMRSGARDRIQRSGARDAAYTANPSSEDGHDASDFRKRLGMLSQSSRARSELPLDAHRARINYERHLLAEPQQSSGCQREFVRARLPIFAPEEQGRWTRFGRPSRANHSFVAEEANDSEQATTAQGSRSERLRQGRLEREQHVLGQAAMDEMLSSESDEANSSDDARVEGVVNARSFGMYLDDYLDDDGGEHDDEDNEDESEDAHDDWNFPGLPQLDHEYLSLPLGTGQAGRPLVTPVRRAATTATSPSAAPDSLGSPDPVQTMRIVEAEASELLSDESVIRRRQQESRRRAALHEMFAATSTTLNDQPSSGESPKRRRLGRSRAGASELATSAGEARTPRQLSVQPQAQPDTAASCPVTAPRPRDMEFAQMHLMSRMGDTSEERSPFLQLDFNQLPGSMTMAEVVQIACWTSDQLRAGHNLDMADIQQLRHRQTSLTGECWARSFYFQVTAGTSESLAAVGCAPGEQPSSAVDMDSSRHENIADDQLESVVLLGQLVTFCQLLSRVSAVGQPDGWEVPPASALQAVVEECKLPNLTRQMLLQQQDPLVQACCMYPQWLARLCSDPLLQPLASFDARFRVAQNLAVGRSRRILHARSSLVQQAPQQQRPGLSNSSYLGGGSLGRLANLGEPTREKALLRREKLLHDGQRLFKHLLKPRSAMPTQNMLRPYVINSQESIGDDTAGQPSLFTPAGQQCMVWPQVPDGVFGARDDAANVTDAVREERSRNVMIEFCDERGHGEGPTQEFYTLFCRKIMGAEDGIWQVLEDHSQLPSRMGAGTAQRGTKLFRVVGYLLGKALQDSRLLDLPLHSGLVSALMRRLTSEYSIQAADNLQYTSLGEDAVLQPLFNFARMEPAMWRSLRAVLASTADELAALDLAFTFPGSEQLELCDGGSNCSVDTSNVYEFVQRVADFATIESLEVAVSEIMRGVAEFIPLTAISCLQVHDLLAFATSPNDELWDADTILACIVCKHGYNPQSRQVQDLVAVMTEFDPQQRMNFLQFVTGAPRLPMLGFRGLQPPMTVVKKEPLAGVVADETLPSCSTCQVYLKLPEYSSKEALRAKVLQAVTEGREYFALD